MSTLVVSELVSTLTQYVRPKRSGQLKAIRPHLLVFGNPAGSLRVEVVDIDGKVIAVSNSVPIASIKTLAYAHKYVRFDITCPVIAGEDYGLSLVAEAPYAFAETDYVGLCHDWDDTKVDLDYTPGNDLEKPYDFETWIRGRI